MVPPIGLHLEIMMVKPAPYGHEGLDNLRIAILQGPSLIRLNILLCFHRDADGGSYLIKKSASLQHKTSHLSDSQPV